MDISSITNNSLDIQTLLNGSGNVNRSTKANDAGDQKAEYAKKGEPMYMAEMDADEDGTVTLDEYRDYCKSNNISTRKMVEMSKLASAYRTMQAESQTIDYISKLIPHVSPLKHADSNNSNNNGQNNYFRTDADNANKVSYDDYMKFCEQNASAYDVKSTAKVESDDDGNFVVKNAGKALKLYKDNYDYALKSTFEDEA